MAVTATNRSRPHRRVTRAAFTLIELLVVISVVALLMAVLLPTLARVRKQAKATVCQGKLRQCGVIFAARVAEGEAITGYAYGPPFTSDGRTRRWVELERCLGPQIEDLMVCPMATRPEKDRLFKDALGKPHALGTTFTAGWLSEPDGTIKKRSYGFNEHTLTIGGISSVDGTDYHKGWWTEADSGPLRNSIPVMLDGAEWGANADYKCDGPPYENCDRQIPWSTVCINRHEAHINILFLDWSVRKVGLKELWTMKWNKYFDTQGPWTKAGGVQPEDWPAWMRKFKDY